MISVYFIIGGLVVALSIFLFSDMKKRQLIRELKNSFSLKSSNDIQILKELVRRFSNCKSDIGEKESLCSNLYNFLNEIPFGILTVDTEKHTILSINKAAKNILSIEEKNVVGKKYYLVCKDYKFLASIENAVNEYENNGRRNIEKELDLNIASFKYVKINYIFPTEKTNEVVIIMTDITFQKEIEEKSTKLISDVAHELRTPLTSIHGFSETLLQNDMDIGQEERKKFLKIIESESARLGRLINEILDIVRMESGKVKMTFTKINLSEIVSYVSDLVEEDAANKKIKIIKRIEPKIYIKGNEDKLVQAFLNLVDNAIKYTQSIGDKVEIRLKKDKMNAILEIEDNGPGIPSVYLDRIFERFFRVDKSRNRSKVSGAGLGLSIVKSIIEYHKGFIEAESEVGKGTVFTIVLPLAESNNMI